MIRCVTLFVASVLVSATANAQERGRREPPPEALAACEGRSEGDACSFEGRRGGAVNGTCRIPPQSQQLACVPEGGRRGPPPQEDQR
ncbi:MAG: hypothetical protein AAFX94_15055 [Myxococcota bacterium]